MVIPKINSAHGSDTRNIINRAIDLINAQGKTVQDLVAEGQLTPDQYATLIQTVNGLISKGDVSVLDIDKNKGKFDSTYFTNEFLDDLNNGTVNATKLLPSSVLREHVDNGAITGAKTTFLKPASSNLFNKNNVVYGYSLNAEGEPIANDLFNHTEPINIENSSKYLLGGLSGNFRVTHFDANDSVVNSHTATATAGVPLIITKPTNSTYMVINVRVSQVEGFYINEGSSDLGYEDYYDELTGVKVSSESIGKNSLSGESLKDGSINENKVSFIESSTNLFNTKTATEGFIMSSTGELTPRAGYLVSDYIHVGDFDSVTVSKFTSFRYFDSNRNLVGAFEPSSGLRDLYTLEIPEGVSFIKFNALIDDLNEIQINKGDTLLEYEPFYKKLSEDIEVVGATGGGKTVYISVPDESISYFGIEGNGIDDDTQGLRDYLYHLKDNGGGKLPLPNGIYKITGTLNVPSNTIIEGVGDSTKIILGDNFDLDSRVFRGDLLSQPYIVNEEGAENIFFRDFKVIGNKNQPIDQRHHGVAFIDALNSGSFNVSTEYINYFPSSASGFGAMAYGLGIIRSKGIDVIGGKFEYGGYENIGLEFAEDVVIDRVYTGTGWRTSLQVHQGNKNVKIINSTIRQDDVYAHAGVTYHGRGAGGENDNIVFHNNTVDTLSNGGGADYMGNIQLIGPQKQISFTNNVITGKKNGIYNFDEAELMVVSDNNINCENGVGIRANGTTIVSGNYVNSVSGTNFEKTEGSDIVGSNNIGFEIPG